MTQEQITSTEAQPPLRAYLVIAMGVLAVSLAAIFIRLAQDEGIPSLVIAAGRMTVATLLLTPLTLRRYSAEIRSLGRPELLLAGISGVFLAAHFATWILSLEYTSVLISVVLVNSHPIWVALLEIFFLRARLARLVVIGLVIGILGSIIVAVPSGGVVALGDNPLLGIVLAITGAITVAVYFVIGRKLRGKLSLLPYIWLVYGCSAIVLLLVVALMRIPVTGYSVQGYIWIVAMALVPQLLGHSSFNYVLKYFPATYVGIAVQLEPVFSAIIAFFLFSESPLPLQIVGSATILAGVVLASLGQSQKS
ncbi:MAG: DMT family transporter [Anaerolineae bacterium]|nr:DMT family transporter [Anaerolineae bacterium]